jgi:N-glycosylase/DNA lyase
VADCILLFGAGKHDAFPVDVWMNRVIGTLYDKESFCPEIFGEYCGIAQQYLFYYGRELKIGK